MTTCEELYRKWKSRGNFCQKSPSTAKHIEEYIDYRARNRLKDIEINRCALYPMIRIENYGMLHEICLRKLKKEANRIGAIHVTRRHVIEIINKINITLPITERIKEIPDVRARMSGLQHTIEGVSHETRETFDFLKDEIGIRGNDELLKLIIEFARKKKDILVEYSKGNSEKIQMVKVN